MNDEELLKNRYLDLAGRAASQYFYTYTRFLTPVEQSIFLSMRKDLFPVPARLHAKNDAAIRKILVFGSEEHCGCKWEDPIRILHIRPKAAKFAELLSHRDYLGAVMSLGIERELTGDIIVRGKEAWMYVMDTAVDFITESLTEIRHTPVICEEVSDEVPELAPSFQTMHVNVASERLDLFLAAATSLNREDAKKLLRDRKVFINGRLADSAGDRLRPGDELVIRGFGKYLYDGIASTTRKGRINITLRKYI